MIKAGQNYVVLAPGESYELGKDISFVITCLGDDSYGDDGYYGQS